MSYLRIREQDVIDGSIDHIDIGLHTNVDCMHTTVKHLPMWPGSNVTVVYCDGCPNLTQLPLWPNVIAVFCFDCPRLTQLPMWPKIKRICCTRCPFDYLPLWPSIQHIVCENNKLHWYFKKCNKNTFDSFEYMRWLSNEETKFKHYKHINRCFDDNVFHKILSFSL